MTEDEPREIIELPAERWRWMYVPIALCGFGSATAAAVGTLFDNLVYGMGMHIQYRRLEEAPDVPAPLFRED